MIYREPSLPGRKCSLLVYRTHFAPRFDPSLDQSAVTTQIMKARRDSLMGTRRLDNSKEAVAAYPIRRATVGIVH